MEGRKGGIPRIWVYHPDEEMVNMVKFEEKTHDVGLGVNYEFDAQTVAIEYDSLVTPSQTIELPLALTNGSERVVL